MYYVFAKTSTGSTFNPEVNPGFCNLDPALRAAEKWAVLFGQTYHVVKLEATVKRVPKPVPVTEYVACVQRF